MENDLSDGVLIGDGSCYLSLHRVSGKRVDMPVLIKVKTGAFTGEVGDDDLMYEDLRYFQGKLIALYRNLSGEAELNSLERKLRLIVKGDGRGGMLVKVELRPEFPPAQLKYEFNIDQTYLPKIVRQIDSEFPGYLPPMAPKNISLGGVPKGDEPWRRSHTEKLEARDEGIGAIFRRLLSILR